MVCAPGVLLAAMIASRSEMRPSAPGRSLTRACAARVIRIKGGIGGIGEGSDDEGLSPGRRGKTPEGKAASHYQYRDEIDSYSVRVHNFPPYWSVDGKSDLAGRRGGWARRCLA